MQTHFIKHRLFMSFGLLTSALCLLFGGITWLFAVVTEDDVMKQVMHTEAQYIQHVFETSGDLTNPRVDYISLYKDEQQIPASIAAGIAKYDHEKEFSVGSRNFHFEHYTLSNNQGFTLLIEDTKLAAIGELSGLLNWFLLIVTSIVLSGALVLAWLISNRIARPIEQLTQDVLGHQPGTSFSPNSAVHVDEVSLLSAAFSSSLNENFALLQRERNFTRDVSHELRTPIALLQNTLLLSGTNPIDADDKALITQVSESLKNTVEVLLALARSENFSKQAVDVKPILERLIVMMHHNLPNVQIDIRLDIAPPFILSGNPVLIELLFQNLINNGVYHSGTLAMWVRREGDQLIFENKIVPQTNAIYQGLGHGQYLVQRIVEALNWELTIDKSDDHYRVSVGLSQSEL